MMLKKQLQAVFLQSLLTIVVSATFATQAAHAQGLVMSIREQLDLAREFDPHYASAVASQEGAQQGLRGAQAGLGPQVTFSASSFRSDRTEETNTTGGAVEIDRRINSHLAQVQARQPVYRKRLNLQVEKSQAELDSSRAAFLASEQDLYARLLAAWLEVLTAREQIEVQTKAVEAANELLLESQRRQTAGEAGIQDVALAQAKVLQAQAQLEDVRVQLEIAHQGLRVIAGPRASLPPTATLKSLIRMPAQPRLASELADLISKANFEVRSARFEEDAARFERDKAQADRYPTLDAYALVSKGDNDAVSTIKDEQRIGLQLSIPLYTSGVINAAVAQADAKYRKAQSQTRAILLRTESDALSSNSRLHSLSKRISATERSIEAAQVMVRAMQSGVVSGVNTRAEVAKALQELATAQSQLIVLQRDFFSAWLIVEKSISALDLEQLERLERISQLPIKGSLFSSFTNLAVGPKKVEVSAQHSAAGD